MAINDALSAVDVSTDIKDLTKLVKQFPVRDGEKPWTAREVVRMVLDGAGTDVGSDIRSPFSPARFLLSS